MTSSKKGKKRIVSKILISIGILVAVLIGAIVILFGTKKAIPLEISNIDISTISDGTYIGSGDNGMVKATVSVEVSNGEIQNITILSHEHLLGKPAEKIVEDIVAQQSLDVDAITSATYSSDTLRKAVENALLQGE